MTMNDFYFGFFRWRRRQAVAPPPRRAGTLRRATTPTTKPDANASRERLTHTRPSPTDRATTRDAHADARIYIKHRSTCPRRHRRRR